MMSPSKHLKWLSMLLAVPMCATSLGCLAQTQEVSSTRKDQLTVDGLRAAAADDDHTYHTFDNRYKGIKGTPFLSKSWQKADLQLESNQLMKDVPIKYDLIANNLLAMRPNGDSIILAYGFVTEFVMHGGAIKPVRHLYRHYTFRNDGKVLDRYFEVLAESKDIVLLKQIKKEINRFNKTSNTYSAQSGYDEIEDKIEYYLFSASGNATPLKSSRKGLDKALKELGLNNGQVLDTINAPIHSEQDLVAVFQTVTGAR